MSKSTPTALRVTHSANVVTVSAGTVGNPGNRKFRNESAFWYALLQTLRLQGHTFWGREPVNLVKKIMSKDGHLVGGDTCPYYLRDRKWRSSVYYAQAQNPPSIRWSRWAGTFTGTRARMARYLHLPRTFALLPGRILKDFVYHYCPTGQRSNRD